MQPKWLTQDILLGVAIDMWTGDIGARIGIALGLMRRGWPRSPRAGCPTDRVVYALPTYPKVCFLPCTARHVPALSACPQEVGCCFSSIPDCWPCGDGAQSRLFLHIHFLLIEVRRPCSRFVTPFRLMPHRAQRDRCSFFMAGFGLSVWAPLVPYVRERIEMTDAVFGLLLLCIGIGSLTWMPISGVWWPAGAFARCSCAVSRCWPGAGRHGAVRFDRVAGHGAVLFRRQPGRHRRHHEHSGGAGGNRYRPPADVNFTACTASAPSVVRWC